jgi:hypothetical protein
LKVRGANETKPVIEGHGRLPAKQRVAPMSGFEVLRLGVVMEPEAGNALEAEGVLNPGAVRARDDRLYLFPRLVARGNY